MKTLKYTKQFKKDLKRIQHNQHKKANLKTVLELLRAGNILPPKYKPHMLTGPYKGYMECHVENDILLIWLDVSEQLIELVRFGSHSELFGH